MSNSWLTTDARAFLSACADRGINVSTFWCGGNAGRIQCGNRASSLTIGLLPRAWSANPTATVDAVVAWAMKGVVP